MDPLIVWMAVLVEGMAVVNAAVTLFTRSRRAAFLIAVNTLPPVTLVGVFGDALSDGIVGWRTVLAVGLAYLYAFRQGWIAPAWFGTGGGDTTEYGAHTGSGSLTRRGGGGDDALLAVALTNMAGWLLAAPLLGMMARTGPFDGFDAIGILLYLLGSVLQSGSALQRFRLGRTPPPPGQPLNTGFWSLCRHPDCFGDVLVFAGLAALSASPWGLVAPLACAVQYGLDAIPLREQVGATRHGPAWDDYRARVACLIPFVW